VLNGLYLLYTSQNLLGTIFRVTFTVFYRRIWNIVGKYSILCCDSRRLELGSVRKALTYPCELLSEIGVVTLQSALQDHLGNYPYTQLMSIKM
jgi:hypothetical protein